jgi:molybdopterin adenylyltransferase
VAETHGFRLALVVVSDKAARGQRQDECLPAMREGLPPGCEVAFEQIVADEAEALQPLLVKLADVMQVDGVLTSGGTGLGPRDVTPQATQAIADYDVPGIAEAMRVRSAADVPTAILSRAVAVVRKQTLIVNLPGSPRAVRQTMSIIGPVLTHAFELLRGRTGDHPAGH